MRSLGVIFLADVVGYSKMMAQDEPGTLDKLRSFTKEVIRPTLEKHSGNMIKSLGDGWLIEFNSALLNSINQPSPSDFIMFPLCFSKVGRITSLVKLRSLSNVPGSSCAIILE